MRIAIDAETARLLDDLQEKGVGDSRAAIIKRAVADLAATAEYDSPAPERVDVRDQGFTSEAVEATRRGEILDYTRRAAPLKLK